MAKLTINPISNPDDIRKEAAANTPQSPVAAMQAQATEPQKSAVSTLSPHEMPLETSGELPVNGEQGVRQAEKITSKEVSPRVQDRPEVAQAESQAVLLPEPSRPAAALTMPVATADPTPNTVAPKTFDPSVVYPSPTHAAKVAETIENQHIFNSYRLPVGVYIIASFALFISLIVWICVLFVGARHWMFFLNGVLFAACGVGLLLANSVMRWVSIVASGIGVAYYGYNFIKTAASYVDAMQQASYYGSAFDSYLKGGLALFAVGVLYLAFSVVYLCSQRVASAFK
ncbi:MAG: hypothetical protein WBP26_04145 [Candidatus Saccharimonadales bacterium]